jgi:hypothetical protein
MIKIIWNIVKMILTILSAIVVTYFIFELIKPWLIIIVMLFTNIFEFFVEVEITNIVLDNRWLEKILYSLLFMPISISFIKIQFPVFRK